MTADKKLWRNRKERKEWARRLQSEDPGLEVVHPHAAGIDVGNSAHYVAVRPDRERDPLTLAALSDPRVHASQEEIAKSLEGNWRPELLFVLQQEVDMYDIYQKRITECDQRLQEHLASLTHSLPVQLPTQKAKTKKPATKK